MNIADISGRLLPSEHDPKLREFITRISYPGLKTLCTVEFAAPFLMLVGRLAANPVWAGALERFWQTAGMALVGLLTFVASRSSVGRRHARLVSGVSVWLASLLLIAAEIWTGKSNFAADEYILAGIALVVFTAAATVPFRTLEMLLVGLSVAAIYALWARFAVEAEITGAFGYGVAHNFFLLMLILLATGLSSANYQHRKAEFDALQQAIRAAEALTGGQLRAQLAENAISIGKLAAALTHEINTPLGAMRSSIETLLAITDRHADAPPEKREILAKMRVELCQSIRESTARIEDVMARLRRFITLEEAELKSADINDLLTDVALLYREQINKGHIRLEFDMERSLPPLECRPQLLSAVFSSLLSNAIKAVNGSGGQIGIVTRRNESGLRVTVSDNGRGMTADEADTIFEPSFKVAAGRVSSGNWSLFNTRQIVYEHGGEIRIDTAPGKGTAFHVNLPLG